MEFQTAKTGMNIDMQFMNHRLRTLEQSVIDCQRAVEILLKEKEERDKYEQDFEDTLWRIRHGTGDEPTYFWLGEEG